MKEPGHTSKVRPHSPTYLLYPNKPSPRQLRRRIHPHPPPRLPASPTPANRRMFLLARRHPGRRNRRELCSCGSRHIQFRTWHTLEIETATHHIPKSTTSASGNKRRGNNIWTRGRISRVVDYSRYICGFDSVLSS